MCVHKLVPRMPPARLHELPLHTPGCLLTTAPCAFLASGGFAQWDIFNEFEFESQHWGCDQNASACAILQVTRDLDPTRLVDFNSGGPGNAYGIGDVNDIHSCVCVQPVPLHPLVAAGRWPLG
mgnify:CR=1 FL=1